MIAFETGVGQVTGTFPTAKAKNSSTVGGTDGTPLVAAVYNTSWGFFQALMNAANLTPNGIEESYDASQLLSAARLALGGEPGDLWLSLIQDPVAAGVRALVLTSQVISIASYPDLVANTYVGDANNANTAYQYFYKCSDAGGTTRDTAGTYFKLPDFRGVFLRGLDTGGTRNPNGASDFLANYRVFAVQGHVHGFSDGGSPAATRLIGTVAGGTHQASFILASGPFNGNYNTQYFDNTSGPSTDGSHGAVTQDAETRPMQGIIQIGIRY